MPGLRRRGAQKSAGRHDQSRDCRKAHDLLLCPDNGGMRDAVAEHSYFR